MLQFSVIIPVYNKWNLTSDCLKSLRAHTHGNDFEVIVVDNASSDGTQTEAQSLGDSLFPEDFIYIRNGENKNFSGACNQGARAAKSNLLFFLNNDTLLTANWAPPLLEALNADPNLGAVGPRLLYPEQNLVQHIGAAFSPQGKIGHFYHLFPGEHPLALKRRELNVITAAALMLRKKYFFEAGCFFEGYRNGFEDVDLSYNLRQNGRKLSAIGESTVYHLESKSEGRHKYELSNSRLLSARCKNITRPDLHTIVMADGYRASLSKDLTLHISLSEQRELEMQHKLNSCKNAAAAIALVDEEPLWEKGYQQLLELFLSQKDHFHANHVITRYVQCCPRAETFYSLDRYARMLDQKDAIRYCEEALGQHRSLLEDVKTVSNIYYSIVESAEQYEDVALKGLLKDWRKKHGPKYLATKR